MNADKSNCQESLRSWRKGFVGRLYRKILGESAISVPLSHMNPHVFMRSSGQRNIRPFQDSDVKICKKEEQASRSVSGTV